MLTSMRLCIALIAAVVLCGSVRADTVVMKTGETLDGTILSENDRSIELEVEYGTMRVPRSRILRIEEDTPEKIAAREKKAAEEQELADKMREEGKVLYKGQWVTEDEKKKAEDKIAKDKKKKEEERKKKAAEEDKKKKEEEKKRQEQARQNQNLNRNNNNQNYDPRMERFYQRRAGSDNNSNYNNNYNNSNRYNNNNNYNNSNNYSNTLNSLYQRGGSLLNSLNNKW